MWKRVHRSREAWEKKFEKKIGKYLFEARKQTLANIETSKQLEAKGIETRASSGDLIWEITGWLADWVKELLGISRSALERAGYEVWTEELEKDDPLTMPAAEVMRALDERENMIRGAGERVWLDIKRGLDEGILKGETMDELAARVRSGFQGMSKERAGMIARTETTVIYETGRDMTFRAAGVEWTEWVHSGLDEHARASHMAADGQVREMGEPFDIGGVPMRFPGDPEAPPGEVINCRCVRIARSGPDTTDTVGNDSEEIPF